MLVRSSLLLDVLASVSSFEALIDETTSEYRAYQWLDKFDEMILCAHAHSKVVQRYIMVLFYFAMNGNEWSNCRASNSIDFGVCTGGQRWLEESHECEWFGLSCEGDGKPEAIKTIVLKKNNLKGAIPVELFLINDLIALSLGNNKHIGGSIPGYISSLTKLALLDLSNNAVVGTLPDSIYSLTELKSLNVASNMLSGNVLDDISNLINLSVLQVNDNRFSGPIPASGLSQLENLRTSSEMINPFCFPPTIYTHFSIVS
jgi:Leucine-rich repeat (LRR) protein